MNFFTASTTARLLLVQHGGKKYISIKKKFNLSVVCFCFFFVLFCFNLFRKACVLLLKDIFVATLMSSEAFAVIVIGVLTFLLVSSIRKYDKLIL
jgi:hypothetical protein